MIETLNADGKPLEEKRGFTFITSGERSAITNLANEIQCRPIVLTQGLNCHWLKDKGARHPAYFRVLRSAACSAAEPPNEARGSMYEAAQLWATVASHARYLPCDHGTSVAPPGLLPSELNRPRGSLVLGTPAFTRARHMMSLMAKWRCDRPWDFLHTSPWWPSEPTSAPQWQTWGPHRSSPNLRPTATLTASLSRARPHDAIGIAISQSAE